MSVIPEVDNVTTVIDPCNACSSALMAHIGLETFKSKKRILCHL